MSEKPEIIDWSDTASKKLEEYKKEAPNCIEHFAWRYLHLENRISEMGGWANFKHYIIKEKDKKYIRKLKAEINILKEKIKENK